MPDAAANTSRTIAVVGATGGIGAACVERLLQQGVAVVVCGRDQAKLTAHFGSGVSAVLDLVKTESLTVWAKALPPLDGVIFASGISSVQPMHLMAESKLREVLRLNVEGPLLAVKELVRSRKLRWGASIVFIGSIAAQRGSVGYTAYTASKGALNAAVRPLALELASAGVRANVLEPGLVETSLAARARESESSEASAAHAARYPLGRGTPHDIAAAAAFLVGPESRWITGTRLVVDGGFSAG